MSFFTHEVHIPSRLFQFYTAHLPCLQLCHLLHNLVAAEIGHRPRSSSRNLLVLPTLPTKQKSDGSRLDWHLIASAFRPTKTKSPDDNGGEDCQERDWVWIRRPPISAWLCCRETCECDTQDFEGGPTLTPLTLFVPHNAALQYSCLWGVRKVPFIGKHKCCQVGVRFLCRQYQTDGWTDRRSDDGRWIVRDLDAL